jgi:hypothetical protein
LGAEGRQFESDRPDQHISLRIKQMGRFRLVVPRHNSIRGQNGHSE